MTKTSTSTKTMDTICLASTCNGIRCKKTKFSAHYCKVHTTNEICETCGSDMISSTDSILRRSGKSLCYGCNREEGKRTVERMKIEGEEHRVKYEEQRRAYNEQMRAMKLKHEETMREQNRKFAELFQGTSKTHQRSYNAPTQMQNIVDEIF